MPLNGYDRVLTWSEYTHQASRPDNSEMDAISYLQLQHVYTWKRKGKAFVITEVTVNITLVKAKSWVVKDKMCDELLRHEQSHYDIMALCGREMYRLLQTLSAPSENALKEQAKDLEKRLLMKFAEVSATYDAETDHSRNQQEQDKWNKLITSEKKRPNGSIGNLPQKPR